MVEKSVPKRQFTEEFKTEAVMLPQSVGQHEAARRLDLPVATLGNWTHRERNLGASSVGGAAASSPAKRPVSEMEAEIIRLRLDLAFRSGSQYASRAYRRLSASFGMTLSMSRRANGRDNAPMEI